MSRSWFNLSVRAVLRGGTFCGLFGACRKGGLYLLGKVSFVS